MNIALVTPTYLPSIGGLQVAVHSLAAALQRRGCGVLVVSEVGAGGAAGDETVDGVPVWRMHLEPHPTQHHLAAPLLYTALIFARGVALAWRLRRFHTSLVAAHFVGPSAASAVVAAKILGIPAVVTPQGSDLQRFPHLSRRYRVLVQMVLRSATFVTVPSHDLAREASLLVPSIASKSAFIPNGVDLQILRRVAGYDRPFPNPFLLSVGRLESVKGHDVLLRAFSILAPFRPDLRLVIAGDGSRRRELDALAAELGVAERVVFCGPVGRDEVGRLLATCEFVVVPSRSEGRGLFVLEAMAMGKAVVASRVGGIPEIVHADQTGILVPPDDPDALARAVSSLLDHPERRDELGRRALEAADYPDWDEVASMYLDLFADLDAGQPGQVRSGVIGA